MMIRLRPGHRTNLVRVQTRTCTLTGPDFGQILDSHRTQAGLGLDLTEVQILNEKNEILKRADPL